jgi:hypothetical protein
MSNWPKIYTAIDLDQYIDHNTKERWIKCVSYEDFEKLLELAASEIYRSGMSHDKNPEEVKVRLLKQLGEQK